MQGTINTTSVCYKQEIYGAYANVIFWLFSQSSEKQERPEKHSTLEDMS